VGGSSSLWPLCLTALSLSFSLSVSLSHTHSLSLSHTQKLEKGQMAKDVSVIDEAPTVIVEEEQLLG
jgi:hypothetical protein